MNKIFTIAFIFISMATFAQVGGVGINANGNPPAPTALLDLSSTSKGVLIPRLTLAQRDSISNPDFGLLILNTTTNCINIWLGATWKQICGDCDFTTPVPGNNGPICQGQTLNLTATTILGATYQWSGPNGFTSTQQNPSIDNATAGASGSYSVQATLNGCTTQPQSTVATVNAIPQTPTASNNGPVCVGQSITLSSTTISGASYTWSGPNGFAANSQSPVITNIQTNDAGNYNVIASVSGCNSESSSTTVVVNATPSTPGSISGPASVCANSTGNVYTISPVSGASSYNWTVPAGASISANADTAITVSFGSSPSGNVTVSATNGCGTSPQSIYFVNQNYVCSPYTLSYTGSAQSFTVPAGITSISITAYGAQGGTGSDGSGGLGGSATGSLTVTPGQTIYVYVGGQPNGTTGGFNGGGNGVGGNGRGGGGASDVRSPGSDLGSRIIIAGGGGGATGNGWTTGGGAGGGTTGGNGTSSNGTQYCGKGGSQSGGGQGETVYQYGGASENGSLGQGGQAGTANNDGGGGGGGYYGGGGGDAGGGGGGSGYTGGVNGGSMQNGVQSGNGQVIITW